MQLHKNKELFADAIKTTSLKFGIPEVYIEKDYWVTAALKAIFNSPIASEAVFKGGTSLSKCFQMIERFSEDIDIVVLRRENESDNQMKKKIKQVSEVVSSLIPEIEMEGITRKRGQIRKTAHGYAKNFVGAYGQVREQIVLEASWLGNSEPFETASIRCMIAEMMLETKNEALLIEFELTAFEVQVLHPFRTFCEKIMSLVRFSYASEPYFALGHKIRHVYDLFKMLQNDAVRAFFISDNFDLMLQNVGRDDIHSFRNNNDWIVNHPSKAIIFANSVEVWKQIPQKHRQSFTDLVYGEMPMEELLQAVLLEVHIRVSKVNWLFAAAG